MPRPWDWIRRMFRRHRSRQSAIPSESERESMELRRMKRQQQRRAIRASLDELYDSADAVRHYRGDNPRVQRSMQRLSRKADEGLRGRPRDG